MGSTASENTSRTITTASENTSRTISTAPENTSRTISAAPENRSRTISAAPDYYSRTMSNYTKQILTLRAHGAQPTSVENRNRNQCIIQSKLRKLSKLWNYSRNYEPNYLQ